MIILILKDQYSVLGMCETERFNIKHCEASVHANTGGEDRIFVVVRDYLTPGIQPSTFSLDLGSLVALSHT